MPGDLMSDPESGHRSVVFSGNIMPQTASPSNRMSLSNAAQAEFDIDSTTETPREGKVVADDSDIVDLCRSGDDKNEKDSSLQDMSITIDSDDDLGKMFTQPASIDDCDLLQNDSTEEKNEPLGHEDKEDERGPSQEEAVRNEIGTSQNEMNHSESDLPLHDTQQDELDIPHTGGRGNGKSFPQSERDEVGNGSMEHDSNNEENGESKSHGHGTLEADEFHLTKPPSADCAEARQNEEGGNVSIAKSDKVAENAAADVGKTKENLVSMEGPKDVPVVQQSGPGQAAESGKKNDHADTGLSTTPAGQNAEEKAASSEKPSEVALEQRPTERHGSNIAQEPSEAETRQNGEGDLVSSQEPSEVAVDLISTEKSGDVDFSQASSSAAPAQNMEGKAVSRGDHTDAVVGQTHAGKTDSEVMDIQTPSFAEAGRNAEGKAISSESSGENAVDQPTKQKTGSEDADSAEAGRNTEGKIISSESSGEIAVDQPTKHKTGSGDSDLLGPPKLSSTEGQAVASGGPNEVVTDQSPIITKAQTVDLTMEDSSPSAKDIGTKVPMKRDSSLVFLPSTVEPASKRLKEADLPSPPTNRVIGERVLSVTTAPGSSGKSALPSTHQAVGPPPKSDAVPAPVHLELYQIDPDYAALVKLDPIPDITPLPRPTPRDIAELESALQIGDKYNHDPENGWRADWSGNLQLVDKDLVMNRDKLAQNPTAKPITMPFCDWVSKSAKNSSSFRGVELLFAYIYHTKGTPLMAQKIMAHSLQRNAKTVDQRLKFIVEAIRRISYDPVVLRQDGWTTAKAPTPDGASGGAYLIGRRVIWHRYEAIVIAFVRDEEIGDLWKAMWLEDLDTFDLEADELQEALKKWEAKDARRKARAEAAKGVKNLSGFSAVKHQGSVSKPLRPATSLRYAASENFSVDGIDHGIILAASFNPNARLGVLWPARVMHTSEIQSLGAQQTSRRSSSKNIIHVVFLAPYWNGQHSKSRGNPTSRGNLTSSNATNAKNAFCTGPLFEMDTVEVSESTIQKYPLGSDDVESGHFSIDKLQAAFRFLGLPKAAFARFLDSHRLAVALKTYARRELSKKSSSVENNANHAQALSALTDCHAMSVRTAIFPSALLNLPFEFILNSLPPPAEQVSQLVGEDGEEVTEQILQLHQILQAMTPPQCWGKIPSGSKDTNESKNEVLNTSCQTPQSVRKMTPVSSPVAKFSLATPSAIAGEGADDSLWSLSNFGSEYLLSVIGTGTADCQSSELSTLGVLLAQLISRLRSTLGETDGMESEQRRKTLRKFLNYCLAIKGHGEDLLSVKDVPSSLNVRNILCEWRKACERIYKRATGKYSTPGFGNGVTYVLTDTRCNQHITASGSFERAVRLPAAIKGAKKAGAGSLNVPLITKVNDIYMDLAEKKILPKAHKLSYLKRMKAKIAALPADTKGAPLTDDSDGEGGEDTMGSRGSYTAAVAGVAAAIQAVDMVVEGQCVNAFCAVRPPGHHAGRELRPMKAISNGFCLLNAAACAALFATAPRTEGGLGLKRVCVIDFDVHHGNGTQDILCSTHDSRFLYVSLHAGGAEINGYEDEGDDSETDEFLRRSLGRDSRQEGIFPGRCGDTSPHEGVLNIPLGQKVTAHAIGNALVSRVSPAVEAFSPDFIVLSAGFDAHKNDPLGMGGLSAEDFGSVTDVACQMASKSCSGRVISILEGGYGVPCCRQRNDLFLPNPLSTSLKNQPPMKVLDLGDELPDSMEDDVPFALQQKLDRCHQEGFLECIKEHVGSLSRYSNRGPVKK